jgi:hypothetical protein
MARGAGRPKPGGGARCARSRTASASRRGRPVRDAPGAPWAFGCPAPARGSAGIAGDEVLQELRPAQLAGVAELGIGLVVRKSSLLRVPKAGSGKDKPPPGSAPRTGFLSIPATGPAASNAAERSRRRRALSSPTSRPRPSRRGGRRRARPRTQAQQRRPSGPRVDPHPAPC